MISCAWCGREVAAEDKHCSPACAARDAAPMLTADERDLVEFLAGQRNPEALIAAELGVTPQAWGRLRKSDPATREAIARGKAREHKALVDALFSEAVEGGNVNAAQFLLRARHGYDDKSSAGDTTRVQVAIQLPAALSTDQYARLVEVSRLAERNEQPALLAEVVE